MATTTVTIMGLGRSWLSDEQQYSSPRSILLTQVDACSLGGGETRPHLFRQALIWINPIIDLDQHALVAN